MTKVEHTKTHEIPLRLLPTMHGLVATRPRTTALVADAELILIEEPNANRKEHVLWKNTNGQLFLTHSSSTDLAALKPILISRTEKIEGGDRVLLSNGNIVEYEGDQGLFTLNPVKILALPEHFSPQQLQDIVDSKLKEGKCLVECERYSNSYATVIDEAAKDSHKHEIRIKLNPHIAIYNVVQESIDLIKNPELLHSYKQLYPVEENAIEKLKKIKPDFDKSESYQHGYQHGFHDAVEVMIKWFEQNVK